MRSFFERHAAPLLWVGALACAGTACRYGCTLASKHLGLTPPLPPLDAHAPVFTLDAPACWFGDLLSNTLGSLVMGLLAGLAPWSTRRFPAIHTGFATGFCGCFTTFSGWNNDVAGYFVTGQIIRALTVLLIGLSMPICALRIGLGIGTRALESRTAAAAAAPLEKSSAYDGKGDGDEEQDAELGEPADEETSNASRLDQLNAPQLEPAPLPAHHRFELLAGALLLLACLATFATVGGVSWTQEAWLTSQVGIGLLIAPFFAAARYILSLGNKRYPQFPLFTLLCNLGGAAIDTSSYVLTASTAAGANTVQGVALFGALMLGGAGCLSTVSTFVNEIRMLRIDHAFVYVVATLALGQAIAVPIWYGFAVFDGDASAG
jgi:fluoride ion exporter CrcB/FEX